MTILVTGGAGFIGSNFIIDWLEVEEEPIVNVDLLTYAGNLDNLEAVANDSRYCFYKYDIGDSLAIESLLSHHRPRAIIHFAAESHVDRSIADAERFVQTNILGTFRLLESSRKYWSGLSARDSGRFRFVNISTDEVYGSLTREQPAFGEDSGYQPNSPYSASKAASDHFVRAFYRTHGLPIITTNCSNNYGPYQFPEKLIPLAIVNALKNRPIPVYGDGLQVRDWLFVSDHCSAIREILRGGSIGETYNIGDSCEKTNLEVVGAICDLLDIKRPLTKDVSYRSLITHVPDRLGHDRRYAVDSSKLRRELKWKAEQTFETGISKTVDWYLEN
jgi:dTDP-glucose 4,6-dehydratase